MLPFSHFAHFVSGFRHSAPLLSKKKAYFLWISIFSEEEKNFLEEKIDFPLVMLVTAQDADNRTHYGGTYVWHCWPLPEKG
nr:hypothetical protein [uncultured Celeribacter sp.]